jgi:hypothetical protein
MRSYRDGDLCKNRIFGYGARVYDPQRLDLQGGVLRLTEPRSTFAEVSNGVEADLGLACFRRVRHNRVAVGRG